MDALLPRPRAELAPGAVHMPDWLGFDEQRELVAACRGCAGYRHTRLPNGGVMSVQSVCLGWHWYPYGYSRTTGEGTPVQPLPDWLADLGRRALADAYGEPAVVTSRTSPWSTSTTTPRRWACTRTRTSAAWHRSSR